MALVAVQQFQRRAVRVHAVQVDGIIARRVIPTTEYNTTIDHDRRVQVMTLVKRDLLDAGAVIIHYVKIERRLILILVFGRETALAFIEQHCLRLRLPGGREYNASVGQVLRHDVVANLGRQVRGDNAFQHVSFEDVLPDVPRRQIFFVNVRVERHTHGKEQATTIVVDLNVANRCKAL